MQAVCPKCHRVLDEDYNECDACADEGMRKIPKKRGKHEKDSGEPASKKTVRKRPSRRRPRTSSDA